MSGGHFDYKQYYIDYIADEVEQLIENEKRADVDPNGRPVARGYPRDVVDVFVETARQLREVATRVQRIDWLVSNDDGVEQFRERLAKELETLEKHYNER